MSPKPRIRFAIASILALSILCAGCFAIDPWIQIRAGVDGISITIEKNGRIPSQPHDLPRPRATPLVDNETRFDLPD